MPPTHANSLPKLVITTAEDDPDLPIAGGGESTKKKGMKSWMSSKLKKMFSKHDSSSRENSSTLQRGTQFGGSCPDLNSDNRGSFRSHNTGAHVLQGDKDYDLMLANEKAEFVKRVAEIEQSPVSNSTEEEYSHVKKLGVGMFGNVYLVRKDLTGEQFAIKEINVAHRQLPGKGRTQLDHIKQCAEAERNYLHATNSPFIVAMHDFYQDEKRMCLVMEYLDGKDLFDQLQQVGRFSEKLTRFYTAQIVLALEYIHNVGLIHRDLKPENIVLTSDGYIKLVDLGLSKFAIQAFSYVGTLGYRAPEIVFGQKYDKTVDWWAVGILIYEMLMGPRRTPLREMEVGLYLEHVAVSDKCIRFSTSFPGSPVSQLMIRGFLKVKPAQRLGNGDRGSHHVRRHPWFHGMNWRALYNKKVSPPQSSFFGTGSDRKSIKKSPKPVCKYYT